MSKTYKIRISHEDHREVQALCDAINSHRPVDLPRWQPENLARFLILRGVELFYEDANIVHRFLHRDA